jgi:SAM-dependent methyltransferase
MTSTPSDTVIPPAEIRYRIVSSPHSEEEYRNIGQWSVDSIIGIVDMFSDVSKRPARVLDFGCGCARTIQPMHRRCPAWSMFGTDIDGEGVAWSRANVPYAVFDTNSSMPPLSYADASFDFIYALSVFSHLDRDMQTVWLAELVRVLKLGGLLYITFNGQNVLDKVPNSFQPGVVAEYQRCGFSYVANIDDGVLPDWYQTSLQSADFVASCLPAGSEVLYHKSGGHVNWQDVMLISRRTD